MLLIYVFFIVTCYTLYVQSLLSNMTRFQEFPSIKEGDPCVKGKMYKMSCNTCHCAANNALYCTKMACLENDDMNHYNLKKKPSLVKTLRNDENSKGNKKDPYLPILPVESCIPGKLYRKGCKKCRCDYSGKPVCSLSKETGCKELPKLSDIKTPNDVSPPIANEELWNLPILPHSASKCEAGKMYMVDCNSCFCLNNGNLLCENLLCLNQDEENTEKAKTWSGAACGDGAEIASSRCVRCDCVDDITKCQPVQGCVMPKVLKLHGNTKIRLSLNVNKEKCEPGAVYKTDCNNCFCQHDRTLRCTQKTCLSYRQTLMLKKQRNFLERYGL